MTLQQLYARRTTLRDLAWGLAACAAVVAINVVRLALLAWFPQHFELIHGGVGGSVVAWLILIVTVGICLKGVSRAQPAKA